MHLSLESLKSPAPWLKGGFSLPKYDIAAASSRALTAPAWLHLGAGNIFRAFPARALDDLLNAGFADAGLIACETFDGDLIDKAYLPYDNLAALCTLHADGRVDKRVIASVAQALRCDGARPDDREKAIAFFEKPSLQMVTLTITEKGYAPAPGNPFSAPALIRDGLYARYRACGKGLALVSMDNCSHNGGKLKAAVMPLVEEKNDEAFTRYVREKVSFPLTMIDKITPRPDAKVAKMLADAGFEDASPFVTEKKTYAAAFVNAEETEYLVLEDDFPAGRPALEKAGFLFTDRETVGKVERMKVSTCLNPLHTALAVLGCLLGYTLICDEMKDADLKKLVEGIAYREGMPVATDPGILSPEAFAREVLEKRFPNPFMPDTPQRIATDTSQKLSVRFGETIKAYMESPSLDAASLKLIPFVLAAWMRYLLGVRDDLTPFEPSPDPELARLRAILKDVKIGGGDYASVIAPILKDEKIFGLNLCKAGLDGKVTEEFNRLVSGEGAVRARLHALVG